jgi:hypothetical protein
MTHVTWISGWGVAPEGMRAAATSALPEADHCFRAPSADALSDLGTCDILAGWSLGAWRILDAASRGFQFEGRVLLLAPFVAFCSEHGLGGKCSLTQVRWLRRWLERDPEAALKDFYARAGLEAGMPYAGDHLMEGLDRLAADATPELRTFVAKGLPPNFSAVVGEFDPLLNAGAICQLIPGCRVVKGARHRFDDLIGPALGKEPYAV